MNYTTYPNETLVLRRRNEVLVETDNPATGKRQFVAVTSDGFRTDYPLRYSDGRVVYDHPEWFSKSFRKMVSLTLNRRAQ